MNQNFEKELQWVSFLMRLVIGGLLLSAAIVKSPTGVSGTIDYYLSVFKGSMMPEFLIKIHAALIIFVELGFSVWLLSGWRLGLAWKAVGVLLLTLATGMVFAGQYETASNNYIYVVMTTLGLLVHRYDHWTLGPKSA